MADPLTVREVLNLSARWLRGKGIESARLDTELLAAEVMGIRRLDLYLAPDRPLSTAERDRLRELLLRRAKGEPVAYLRGRKEFHGLDFELSPSVLVPRPETEAIVDAALAWLLSNGGETPRVVDVGTGSGAIACAIAVGCPAAHIVALDISEAAIEVATRNVRTHELSDRVKVILSDMLAEVPDEPVLDMVVSNPPYVAEDERNMLDASARDFEPSLALFSGPCGTLHTELLARQAWQRLRPGGALAVETGTVAQRDRVETILRQQFGDLAVNPITDIARISRGFMAVKAQEGVVP